MISSVSRCRRVVELNWLCASVFIGLCDFGGSCVKSRAPEILPYDAPAESGG